MIWSTSTTGYALSFLPGSTRHYINYLLSFMLFSTSSFDIWCREQHNISNAQKPPFSAERYGTHDMIWYPGTPPTVTVAVAKKPDEGKRSAEVSYLFGNRIMSCHSVAPSKKSTARKSSKHVKQSNNLYTVWGTVHTRKTFFCVCFSSTEPGTIIIKTNQSINQSLERKPGTNFDVQTYRQ